LMLGSLLVLFMVHIAEFVYPGYSVSENYISDLGVGPWPSWAIFSVGVMAFGLIALLVAALLYKRMKGPLWLFLAIGGVGAVGVALFNEDTGAPHVLSAFLAFLFGNLAAIASYKVTRPPFSFFALALGMTGLGALVLLGLGVYLGLGVGGMERMIFYPVAFWALAYGAYLCSEGSKGH
ncbi:MAG: DUF998 domain-containing protein, partial [Methanomassiliicoccales archaeon]|nr:DUF998 domain-containing protein [Methanomassiliicoccales archaeon]